MARHRLPPPALTSPRKPHLQLPCYFGIDHLGEEPRIIGKVSTRDDPDSSRVGVLGIKEEIEFVGDHRRRNLQDSSGSLSKPVVPTALESGRRGVRVPARRQLIDLDSHYPEVVRHVDIKLNQIPRKGDPIDVNQDFECCESQRSRCIDNSPASCVPPSRCDQPASTR